MPNFFVVVSQLKDHGALNREKSGRLWARTFSQAEIEVGVYRQTLNYADLEWMMGEFYVVMALSEKDVKKRMGHTKWWNNRVTPCPIGLYTGTRKGGKTYATSVK